MPQHLRGSDFGTVLGEGERELALDVPFVTLASSTAGHGICTQHAQRKCTI